MQTLALFYGLCDAAYTYRNLKTLVVSRSTEDYLTRRFYYMAARIVVQQMDKSKSHNICKTERVVS